MKLNPILAPVAPATNPATVPAAIADRLTAAIGVDSAALDPGRLKWIVAARCRHLQLPDPEAYAARLEADPAELDALIDEVVVPETRFFRDPAVFDHLRSAAAKLALAFPGPLRILSAPCGTGQEAFSLAAIFQLAGLPPTRFTIDAFDISLSALAIARRGIYPESALRHVTAELQNACGDRRHKHWAVHETLMERIRFDRRNLAAPGALAPEPQYHLILCRNLFIYLNASARKALAESLAAALIPGGRLVLGTADRVEELTPFFSPLRPAASFAFTHRDKSATAIPAPAVQSPPSPRLPRRWGSTTAKPALPPAAPVLDPVPTTAEGLLRLALHHHQRGELRKAERRCRQALYLSPNHLPALELLQHLWDQHPNLRIRRALRDRILRTRIAAIPTSEPSLKETA